MIPQYKGYIRTSDFSASVIVFSQSKCCIGRGPELWRHRLAVLLLMFFVVVVAAWEGSCPKRDHR